MSSAYEFICVQSLPCCAKTCISHKDTQQHRFKFRQVYSRAMEKMRRDDDLEERRGDEGRGSRDEGTKL